MPESPLSAGRSTLAERSRWAAYLLAGLSVALCVVVGPYSALRHGLSFDDAYVYLRYALHIRQGVGVAWNPGAPTYGAMSQIWSWVLVPFTTLPVTGAFAIQLASWLAGLGAMVVVSLTIARNATSSVMRFPAAAFVTAALPLLVNSRFNYQLTTGMDTMLSLLANALVVSTVLFMVAAPSIKRALLAAVICVFAVMTRPENLICALLSPLMAAWVAPSRLRWRLLSAFLSALVALYALDLLICRSYFGVAVPLSFLVNGSSSYAGFITQENGLEYAFVGLSCMLPYLGVLAATWSHANRRLSCALLVPAAITFLGLVGQRQHMGFQGRYFLPLLPYLMVPSLLSFDAALSQGLRSAARRAAIGIFAAVLIYTVSLPLQHLAVRHFLNATTVQAVPVPELIAESREPLPQLDWAQTIFTVGRLVAGLPPQTVVAAAEVGFLGSASPDKTVIDLVGINDNDIAQRGFSIERILDRKPDLIWLPPPDYTGLRSTMVSEPRLLGEYRILAGAFNYGVAIRLASPYRLQIESAVATAWAASYPQRPEQDYVVTGIGTR